MRKRLQVFISSTYTDLISERQAAVEAILTAGHIPAGMELFTSGDESQMDVIKQWIDESDVYLLILGARYGTIEPKTGKSYTHLEYEYAFNNNKPLFACAINESSIDGRVKKFGTSVIEMEHPSKLKEFRELVTSKMVKFWDDTKDIKIAVGETLSNFSRRADMIGWVRSNQGTNMPALTDELARLSKENADLRIEISNNAISNDRINGLSFNELKKLLITKNLLNFFTDHPDKIANRFLANQFKEDDINKLLLLGLIIMNSEEAYGHLKYYYELSTAGRIFLNKLEYEYITTPSPRFDISHDF